MFEILICITVTVIFVFVLNEKQELTGSSLTCYKANT